MEAGGGSLGGIWGSSEELIQGGNFLFFYTAIFIILITTFWPRLALNSKRTVCLCLLSVGIAGKCLHMHLLLHSWEGDFVYNGYESTRKCITYYCQFLNGNWRDMIYKDIGRSTMIWYDNEDHEVSQYAICKRITTKSSSALNPLVMSYNLKAKRKPFLNLFWP